MVRVYSDEDVSAAFVIGDWVQIKKFQAKPKFNGFVGKIKGPFDKKKNGWPVKIKALNKTVHVPSECIKKTSRPKERSSNNKKSEKKPPPVVRKLGPRDIGRHNSYDAAKFDYETEGGFLDERGRKKIDFTQNAFGEKLGPTQIGKNKDYDAAAFDIQDDGDFLADRTVYKEVEGIAERKAGPVEIGRKRQESFKPAKYELPSTGSDFLAARGLKKADSTNLLGVNERVEEIGMAENFSAAKYALEEDDGIFAERGIKKADSTNLLGENQRVEEIGIAKDFKAAKYKIEEDDGIFAERGIKRADSTNLLGENERVEEIGFADGYVDPKYELTESWGMHGERLRRYGSTNKDMVEKKQTVEEIGIAKGFKPYQVGEELKRKKKSEHSETRGEPPDSSS